MARCKGTQDSDQHLPPAAAARPRAKQPREHLAVHAPELALQPNLQILRRHRRPLLLRLEHTHRPAVEDHVNCATRLGSRRLLIVRIGISVISRAATSLLRASNASCSMPTERGVLSTRSQQIKTEAAHFCEAPRSNPRLSQR